MHSWRLPAAISREGDIRMAWRVADHSLWGGMDSGNLIVIIGPAAVGKSTVARALQKALVCDGALWLLIELDVFARSLPREWMAIGAHQGRYAERGFVYERASDGGLGLDIGRDGRRVLGAFHRSVASVVKSGVNVICETIVFDEEDWNDWSLCLEAISVRWVKLSAPAAVLETREKANRSGPFQGLAEGMMARRPVGAFDIEADTSREDLGSIVRRIAAKP
jgi:chloramphenicol 3-O-phosphotransferase